MPSMFDFAVDHYAPYFKRNGFVLVENGVTPAFLAFLRRQLEFCEREAQDISAYYDKRNRKQQYLFEFPDDPDLAVEFVTVIGELTGLPGDQIVLSERHIKVYPEDARPDPPPHKDRRASQVAVGIPILSPPASRLILYPYDEVGENVYDSYDQFLRALPADRRPEVALKDVAPVEIEARPGDMIAFRGSSIFHERMRAAGSKILYLKLNVLGLDPIGENLEMLPLQRSRRSEAAEAGSREPRPLVDAAME